MAAYDIHRHFKALRVDTGRRKGRPDPFASGFEDELDKKKKANSNERKTSQPPPAVQSPPPPTKEKPEATLKIQSIDSSRKEPESIVDEKRGSSSPQVQPVSESDDDNFLSYRSKRSYNNRRASPAPIRLDPSINRPDAAAARSRQLLGARPSRGSRALAVGNLAYLDDSEEEEERPQHRDRRPSPAPGKRSPGPASPPLPGGRERSGSSVPRHTVASPFAGTKYLQDSESDSDEEAIASQRSGSQDSTAEQQSTQSSNSLSPSFVPREVKRVDKPKASTGSGVSWRAFSAGRTEQRNNDLQLLRQTLQKRGNSISFVSHAVTDDGQRIPLGQCCSNKGNRGRVRERSPPRLQQDIEPSRDESAEPRPQQPLFENPFSAIPMRPQLQQISIPTDDLAVHQESFQISESLSLSPTSDALSDSLASPIALNSSIDTLSKLDIAPQTIPESQRVDHSLDNFVETSPRQNLSRTSSAGRFRSLARISSFSRRSSRRSNSNVSNSPAAAFLSSWNRDTTEHEVTEARPDDEGQAIGPKSEYIIGRTINQGGFGIVKEVRTRNERTGQEASFAVKIVRKQNHLDEVDLEQAQQDLDHEVSVWRHLDHQHILKLRMVFETEYATFCVMDLNVGGTLHDIVRKQRQSTAKLDPRLAKHYAYQLASALRYLHEDIKVCHRDVKLENCLVDATVPDYETRGGNLRLCDFGLADFLHSQSIDEERGEVLDDSSNLVGSASSIIGTLEYASPKGLSVHRKLFETAGDVWAYGVIVYALCTSDLPFRHTMPSKTIDAILRADWDANALRQASTSGEGEEVYELVSGCLRKNIEDRWTITDCMNSIWFETTRVDEETQEQRQIWQ